MPDTTLDTERLVLRRWRDEDRTPFAAMNADPEVMEHFPAVLTRAESDAMVDRIEAGFLAHGFGLWAVEIRATGAFAGFVGLLVPAWDLPFLPAVEVGWRLARTAWGQGFAVEAARAALRYGFEVAGLEEVVSMTTTTNLRSQQVMRRLGMTRDPADDFDHPALPVGHRLRRHVLFRLDVDRWRALLPYDPVRLETASSVTAPDGSTVYLLPAVTRAGTAVFALPAGATAAAVRHPRVEEVWHVLRGAGELWRRLPSGLERTDVLRPGVSLVLPRGTAFQFRSVGDGPLHVFGVTSPRWRGPEDAEPADGPWVATVGPGSA